MGLVRAYEEDSAKIVEWFAPSKVNLFLKIVGKRADGYHDLESLFVPLSLGDHLTTRLLPESVTKKPNITLHVTERDLPNDINNLAYRAASIFFQELDKMPRTVEITLDKRTPVGAGLGGGSSDAAAVLLSLNHLLDAPFSTADLAQMAGKLGADVPFFLLETSAIGRGTGTVLEPFPLRESLWFLLVNPGFAVSTAWVYQNFHFDPSKTLTNAAFDENIKALRADQKTAKKPAKINWEIILQNDLERVTSAKHPEIAAIKTRLLSLGAKGALMSGSGPTVFGVYPGTEGESWVKEATRQLEQHKSWKLFTAHQIP